MNKSTTPIFILALLVWTLSASAQNSTRETCQLMRQHAVWMDSLIVKKLSPTKNLQLSYAITSDLSGLTLDLKNQEDQNSSLYFRVLLPKEYLNLPLKKCFKQLTSWYCYDTSALSGIKTQVRKLLKSKKMRPAYKQAGADTFNLYYVDMAHKIAEQSAKNMSYANRTFDELVLTKGNLLLNQINHDNSRSLDHKDRYFLWDLVFYIPARSAGPANFNPNFRMGPMLIYFRNHSAPVHQEKEDKIREHMSSLGVQSLY